MYICDCGPGYNMEFTSGDPTETVAPIITPGPTDVAEVRAVCNTLTGTYDITQVLPPPLQPSDPPRSATNIDTMTCVP